MREDETGRRALERMARGRQPLGGNPVGGGLRAEATARLKTTMIGSIAAIEEELGALWGHGKPRHALSPEELEFEAIFLGLRTRILNLGNAQRRALEAAADEPAITRHVFTGKQD